MISAGERDAESEGVEGMSASKPRAAAVKGDFETFRKGVPSLDDEGTEKLYAPSVRVWVSKRRGSSEGDVEDRS